MNARRDNVAFMLGVLLAWIAQGSIWYTMPLLFSKVLSDNYFVVGLLIAMIPLVEVVVAIPFGYYADLGKIKYIAFDSMLALLAVPLLFALKVSSLNAAGVFLIGAGGIGIWIAATAHVSHYFGRKPKYIGYELAVMGVGWVTGPILGGFLLENFGGVMLAAAETLILAIASFIFLKTMRYKIDVTYKTAPKLGRLFGMEHRAMRRLRLLAFPFLLLSFLFAFFSYTVWVAGPLLARIGDISIFLGGAVIGALEAPYVFGDALAAKFYVRGGVKRIVSVSVLLSFVFMLLSALLVGESFFALIILFGTALLLGIADVALFSALIDSDRRDTGEIAAFATVSGGIGGALAVVIVGATIATYQLYVITAAFGILVAIFLLYLHLRFKDIAF